MSPTEVTPPAPPENPSKDAPHGSREPVGPIIGAGIVVVVLIIGALYFWGAEINRTPRPQDNLPFITGDTATSPTQ